METHRMKSAVGGQRLFYRLRTPQTDSDSATAPVLLFLHGAGERGQDLDLVDLHGPAKFHKATPGLETCFLISPQCPQDHWWRSDTLFGLLSEVILQRGELIDTSRLYVTGLSMGGYATWKLLTDYPDIFAAAAPVCGGGSPSTLLVKHSMQGSQPFAYKKIKALSNQPIWAFHGIDDPVVPISESRRLISMVQDTGNPNAKLTELPSVGHDSWTNTYQTPALYKWLLSQSNPQRPSFSSTLFD